ncbi:hypothetical protein SDC9_193508 [bioreactor metagenome]|uniref:Uncharacterized protein n=1 Tax=bioreactor metagenome TaxID=1076179 RepID=A0A645I6B4_9ZZZZ
MQPIQIAFDKLISIPPLATKKSLNFLFYIIFRSIKVIVAVTKPADAFLDGFLMTIAIITAISGIILNKLQRIDQELITVLIINVLLQRFPRRRLFSRLCSDCTVYHIGKVVITLILN